MPVPPSGDVFVHPKGLCESEDVGPRTRVWAFAHVMAGAHVGSECNIGDHAFVETGAWIGNRVTVKNCVMIWDKVRIEDEVFVGPNAVFTNDRNPRGAAFKRGPDEFLPTVVQRGASVGANATVICGVTVGAYAFVGAGAVVTRDVPAYALVVGNPARRIGWACQCGLRLPESLRCRCERTYRLISDRRGLELANGTSEGR